MRNIRLIVIGLVCILAPGSIAAGQEPKGLNDLVRLQVRKVRVAEALARITVQSEISIGFERSKLDGPDSTITFDGPPKPALELLNLIVQQVPIYKWEVRDGVINVLPVNGRSSLLEKFRALPVEKFEARSTLIKFELRNRIFDLPQVQQFLNENKLHTDRLRDYGYRPSIYARDVDLSVSNTNVEGLINNIIRLGEHNFWSLALDDKGTLYLSF